MSTNPSKLSQFWQELKRRKVVKVIAMYGATAFIIMEAAEIMLPRLGLPDWTVTLIIMLLIAGLPITIIMSWIFDITPEGIKKTESANMVKEQEAPSATSKRRPKLSDAIIFILFIAVCILAYPKLFPADKFKEIRDIDGRITIAVMPFENLTGDTTLNWFQRGVSSLITNGLGSSPELVVHDDHAMYEVMESVGQVFTAGISPAQAKEVARKVHAEAYVSGSFQGRGGKYWIMANLVNTNNGEIILTKKVEGDLKSADYLELANSLCNEIKDHLEIKMLEQEADYDFREAYTVSADAYRYYIEGMNSFLSREYMSAVQSLNNALDIDSTFTFASFYIGVAYNYVYPGQFSQSKAWIKKTYNIKERLPNKFQQWVELWHALYFGQNLQDIIRLCNSLEESGIESRLFWFDLGETYYGFLKQYEKAVMAFEKIEEISKERGGPWEFEPFYFGYGRALHEAGNHEKEKEIYELSLRLFPNNINKGNIFWGQACCALSTGDTTQADVYLKKYITVKKEIGETPDNIEFQLGRIHQSANVMDKAEQHYRNAMELKPQCATYHYHLSKLLIEEDINIDEGMDLIEQAMIIFPHFSYLLVAKGWGCYKLGRYEEALQLLRRADELATEFTLDRDEKIRQVEQAMALQQNEP